MENKPNILLILTDQHRFDYMHCSGAEWLHTPNMDRLAAEGTRFTHCYTNAPICAPARCALASGLQPHRIGCLENHAYIPISRTTFYQRLRDHGYWTGFTGKLDLVKPSDTETPRRDGRRPITMSLGFCDPWEGVGSMAPINGGPYEPYSWHLESKGLFEVYQDDRRKRTPGRWIIDAYDDSPFETEDYEDGYLGQHAVDWLETVTAEFPWFHQVNFLGPHDPFDPPTEYADRYRDAEVPPAIPAEFDGKPEWIKERFVMDGEDAVRTTRQQYSAEIECLDHYIGKMMAVLEARGIMDNTLIIFGSDHGEMLGDFGLYTKSVAYEPSVRVPLILAGPGIPKGKVSDTLVELIDLNATVCDYAGLPPQENIDARSLLPHLRGECDTHRDSVISCLHNFRMYRDHQYKYIQNLNDKDEIYDLVADPKETTNICDRIMKEQPKVYNRLFFGLRERLMEAQWLR